MSETQATINHLQEEFVEFLDAPDEAAAEEAADMAIDCGRLAKADWQRVNAAIEARRAKVG